jgi:hypothetical protein
MFYEIRRYEALIFYKTDGKNLYKLNLTKFLNNLIPDVEEPHQSSLLELRKEFKEFINIIKDSLTDFDAFITEIFSLPKFEDEIVNIHMKDRVESRVFKNEIELEDYLDDKIEHVSKIECFETAYYRNEILTDEYREYEYQKLLEQEEYEILSFITKSNTENE